MLHNLHCFAQFQTQVSSKTYAVSYHLWQTCCLSTDSSYLRVSSFSPQEKSHRFPKSSWYRPWCLPLVVVSAIWSLRIFPLRYLTVFQSQKTSSRLSYSGTQFCILWPDWHNLQKTSHSLWFWPHDSNPYFMSCQETSDRSAHFSGLNLFQMNFQLIQLLKEAWLPSGLFFLIFIPFSLVFALLESLSLLRFFTQIF